VTSTPLRLHLVRHGQTVLNSRDLVQGWHDSSLTEPGLEGVRATAEKLRDVEFQAAYVSPSGRTVATAEQILQHHPMVRMTLDERLKELHFGEFESRPNAELLAVGDVREIFTGIVGGTFAGFTGGEHARDYVERIEAAFDDIVAAHPEGDVLVVSHGVTLFTYLARAAAYTGAPLENASVTVLERGPDGWVQFAE
jgi:probable phosphoglycerate mutase